jgi:hypothetical protein
MIFYVRRGCLIIPTLNTKTLPWRNPRRWVFSSNSDSDGLTEFIDPDESLVAFSVFFRHFSVYLIGLFACFVDVSTCVLVYLSVTVPAVETIKLPSIELKKKHN